MKINTSSWHYKLVSECSSEVSNNLCGYFWQLMISIVCVLLGLVTVVVALIIPVSTLVYLGLEYLELIETSTWVVWEVGTVGLLAWGITIVCLAILYCICREDDDKEFSRKRKPPSVLGQRIKDFKNKNCTMLEFDE